MEHNNNTEIEVEDIMCDQGIIKTEVSMEIETASSTIIDISTTRFQLAVTLLTRALLPTVLKICYSCLRNQKVVLENVRKQVLSTISAFVANNVSRSLSSVQRGIFYPLLPRTAMLTKDNVPEKCVECCVLHEPSSSDSILFDVIFIHGIHGSLTNTWKQGTWKSNRSNIKEAILERSKSFENLKENLSHNSLKRSISDQFENRPNKYSRVDYDVFDNQEENTEVINNCFSKCWPKDWLAKDYPSARIIAVNYTTDSYLWRPLWVKKRNRSGMLQRCEEMINHLLQLNVGRHPIIWVGHSKGGLYIKQIIVHAWEKNTMELRNLYLESKGIMFYSVPHRGSMLADITLPFLRRSIELLEVQRNGYLILNLHKKFLKMLDDTNLQPEIFSFFETSLTFMLCVYLRIVTPDSADPDVGTKWGIPLDHREICKPSGRKCFLYQELVQLIEKVLCYSQ